jgi:hypothetical protein
MLKGKPRLRLFQTSAGEKLRLARARDTVFVLVDEQNVVKILARSGVPSFRKTEDWKPTIVISSGNPNTCFGKLAASSPSCSDGKSTGPKVTVTRLPS